MRTLLAWILTLSLAAGASELDIYAKVFPKVLAYDYNLESKLKEGSIYLGILYDERSNEQARLISELIHQYNAQVSGFPLQTLLIDTSEFIRSPPDVTALLLMGNPLDPSVYPRVRRYAEEKSIIVFAINLEDLKTYASVGLFFGRSVRPMINKKLLIQSNIKLKATLIRFSKVYEDE